MYCPDVAAIPVPDAVTDTQFPAPIVAPAKHLVRPPTVTVAFSTYVLFLTHRLYLSIFFLRILLLKFRHLLELTSKPLNTDLLYHA